MGYGKTYFIKEFSKKEFKALLYKKEIIISLHAYDYLETEERKVFKPEELIQTVKRESPRKIYLQENGKFSVYYRKSDCFRRIIIALREDKTIIVSFMNVSRLPRIRL